MLLEKKKQIGMKHVPPNLSRMGATVAVSFGIRQSEARATENIRAPSSARGEKREKNHLKAG